MDDLENKVCEISKCEFAELIDSAKGEACPVVSGGTIKCTREGFRYNFQKYRIKGSKCYFENV